MSVDLDQRRQTVAQLRDEGLSQRAIAAMLGVSQGAVASDCRSLPSAQAAGEREDAALRADATARLAELNRVKRFLWPDRDDPMVMCELLGILSAIRAAESVLQAESATAVHVSERDAVLDAA